MILKKILSNSVIIALFAFLVLVLHYCINCYLNFDVNFNQLCYSYTINVLMATGVVIILFLSSKKLKDQLGFVFMASSIFKFIVFFIFFYPKYIEDGKLERTEFLTFFIPYAVCLIIESVIMSKFLNQINPQD